MVRDTVDEMNEGRPDPVRDDLGLNVPESVTPPPPKLDLGDDSTDDGECECSIPEIAVGRNEVGAFDVQIVYCEECLTTLRTVIEPISN